MPEQNVDNAESIPDKGKEKLDKATAYLKSDSPERVQNNTVRHQYKVLNDVEKAQMLAVKDKGLEFLNLVDNLGFSSREISLAKTKIEEAVMWAVKGITG